MQPPVSRAAPPRRILNAMLANAKTVLFLASVLCSMATLFSDSDSKPNTSTQPEFTSSGQLKLPAHYREWVYLTTGFDMSYTPGAATHHLFDNVFVNPESYRAFIETGTWPDKTTIVLEVRGARDKGSINQRGSFQSTDVLGVEIHLKDSAHGGWRFYSFDSTHVAGPHPVTDICTSCHAAHGAVDNTFVQFYPTLLPIAQTRSTLSESYLKDDSSHNPE